MATSMLKFEYIQSNHFKQEDECEENKQKKGFEVLSDGFIYVKKKSNKDSNYWKCKHPKCLIYKCLTLTINFNNEIVGVSNVSHSIVEKNESIPEKDWHFPLNENQIKTLRFLKKVKERCSNEEMGPAKVFEDEQNKLFRTLLTSCDKDEVASLIPQFQSLKHGLQKRRNRTHEQYCRKCNLK
ncbi:unnamed protein product [Brachionus calyciflorus]|uniref:FLYWCH-type domain-containing protein n=1 Tax=Brachionus calyciflorus TaxID=104777 RepID=A0A813RV21_9BILA|nr:unnamed protein product [Brachionus calyciflorus]